LSKIADYAAIEMAADEIAPRPGLFQSAVAPQLRNRKRHRAAAIALQPRV
jgi:hypothetical protein